MADSRSVDLDIEGLEDPIEVGVGGFATVYRAYQPAFRRTVAVKVLATLNLDDAARERFERECQAMGSLSEHPNIVTVYGAGFTPNGRPYLVMAYLPGGSLQERLDNQGPLPWQDATLCGVHLAGALETAHRAQIVHRDIKPGNVLMSAYGDAQLTDFGIARISGGHETRSGVITASMAHAPPEVLDGQRPTVSADVYSLGSTIFELMAGTPAFASDEDESMVPMLRRILTEPPPDLRARGVPDPVCQVIERAMAKDPAHRQTSAVQLGRELQAARRALGVDPGKLTVPADVSLDVAEGEEINFVAAPFTAPVDLAGPAAAAAVTAAVPAPTAYDPAAPVPGAAVPPAAAMPATPYAATPATPYDPAAPAGPGGTPGSPVGAAPSSGKSKGLLIGVAALVILVLVVAGGLVFVGGQKSNTAASTTTTAAITSTTETIVDTSTTETTETTETTSTTDSTAAPGYTAEIEASFVDTCVKNPKNTRLFCRCVFKGVKDGIDFKRYLEIEADLQNGVDVSATEVQPIIVDCSKRFPQN